MKRRQLLHLAGAGFVVALSGCSGNGSGNGDNPETESQSSTQTSTATSTEDQETTETGGETSTDQNGSDEGYPTQESSGPVEKKLERVVENGGGWGIKVDNYDYFNVPDVSDDLMELWPDEADGPAGLSFEEALYLAVNGDSSGAESDTVYIFSPTPDGDGPGPVAGGLNFYVNTELGSDVDDADDVNMAIGWAEESVRGDQTGVSIDEDTAREAYRVFFTEHIDGDGIIDHTGEIPDYAREAFETGWQAE